jgi:hypothetical protein
MSSPLEPAKRRPLAAILIGIGLAAAALVAWRADRDAGTSAATISSDGLAQFAKGGRMIAYRSRAGGEARNHLAVVAAASPTARPTLFGPVCDRIAASDRYIVCMGRSGNLIRPYQATLMDMQLKQLKSISIDGVPSRARVSPDEKYFAVTSFVTGDSYAAELFSTRTILFATGAEAREGVDVESYTLIANGDVYGYNDKNVWGVTFVPGQDRFFATVSFNGNRFLVDGDVKARKMLALRSNVECPSLSPDGLRLAYKKRTGNGQYPTWRFHVLDLTTNQEHALAEARSVDDQIAWLDNDTVLYAVARGDNAEEADIWKAPVNGGEPELFIPDGDSPTVFGALDGDGSPSS